MININYYYIKKLMKNVKRALCISIIVILVTLSTNGGLIFADEVIKPYESDIRDNNYYTRYGEVFNAYLAKKDGVFMRVENTGSSVVVEYYDGNYKIIGQNYIQNELSKFGGFYEGGNAYYLVYGDDNLEEDDSKEVVRVVKYSKNWERLGSVSIYGANTTIPFRAGSLSMVEKGDKLYVRTCHQMYKKDDGLRHQANWTFSVDTSKMKLIESHHLVAYSKYGYSSHSFNQFIRVDTDGYIITADHGDAYPRAVVLYRCKENIAKYSEEVNVLDIQGSIGDNDTGVSIGGLEYSSNNYILAGNSVVQDSQWNSKTVRNIFVTVTSKDNFSKEGTELKWITNYTESGDTLTATPRLVKIDNDSFLIMWKTYKKYDYEDVALNYAFINGDGDVVGEIFSVSNVCLSKIQPVVIDGKVTLYTTGKYYSNTPPEFYTIDSNGAFSKYTLHKFEDKWSSNEEFHFHVCSVCQEQNDIEQHTGGTATCISKAICSVCGQAYGEVLSHSYTNKIDDKYIKDIADCLHKATYYYSCETCGEKSSKTFEVGNVNKENHKFASEYTSDATAHWHSCACGAKSDKEKHIYEEWLIVKEATLTEKGSRERKCLVCGYKEIEEIEYVAISGDANSDGEVDSLDAVLMKKYLAGYSDLEIDEAACDVDGDGEVTSIDTVLLLKYLAGYDVELQ